MGRGTIAISTITYTLKDLTQYRHKVRCECGSIVYPNEAIFINGKHYRVCSPISPNKVLKNVYILSRDNNKLRINPVKDLIRCELTGKYFNPIYELCVIYDDSKHIVFNPLLHFTFVTKDNVIKAYSSKDLLPSRQHFSTIGSFRIYKESPRSMSDEVLSKLHRANSNIDIQTHANKNNTLFNLTCSLYENYKIQKLNTILYQIGNLFKDYTFGCEFELAEYTFELPEIVQKCLTPLRDSSIGSNGIELATPILSGYKGLAYLLDVSTLLQARAKANTNCAYHIHIGTDFSRQEIVALYYLYSRIQSEISSMLPNYLKDPVSIGHKSKNYAEHLPAILESPKLDLHHMKSSEYRDYINTSFLRIFKLFRGRESSKTENRALYKVSGVPWQDTWRSASRYFNLNLYNYFFTGIPTVEMRAHQGTTSPYRIMHFALIQLAIVKYARNNTTKILNLPISRDKVTLEDIIKDIFQTLPRVSSYLIAYYLEERYKRSNEFISSIEGAHISAGGTQHRNNIISNRDNELIKKDAEYKFENALDLLCLEDQSIDLSEIVLMEESSDQNWSDIPTTSLQQQEFLLRMRNMYTNS